jgi:hypothetical protein
MAAKASAWLEEYEKTANLVEKTAEPHQIPSVKKAVAALDEKLKPLEKDPFSFNLTVKEVERRRKLVYDLQVKIRPVMGGGTFVRPEGVGGSDGEGGAVQLSVLEQRQLMAEQDLLLDEISGGVDRLHERAVNINDETKLHTNLLSDMDGDVDKALVGMRAETKHAIEVRLIFL